jgi:protein ImuA
MVSRNIGGRGAFVIVDPCGEVYAPAVTGWGLDPGRLLILRPSSTREACWGIEQCLRCPGVSATWAWVERGLPVNVLRRWKLAAESGGGVGLLFRPDAARREPAWADLRLGVTPLSGGQGDARRIRIDVLYRRGGLGGDAQVWEIDHATGDVRLVPEVAHPAAADRAARA